MNSFVHQFRKVTPVCLIVCALGCLAPQTQAVVPPPDGCYPNFTTAEGCKALKLLTSGAGNSGLGWFALSSDTTGNFNTNMEKASETILALRPVTFHYKTDAKDTPQFGLIAEEVAKVNPALVLPDKEGKPFTVRYDAVNAMLLNEFLKEHRKVQELEANDAEQQKQIKALIAAVKEQGAQIQKVSAQLEVSGPAAQVVKNKD